MGPAVITALTAGLTSLASLTSPAPLSRLPEGVLAIAPPLPPHAEAWTDRGWGAIRGVTIGPIESTRHPGKGYGSPAYERGLDEAVRMGATWVSLTPFGRVWDITPDGIDMSFEAPFDDNRVAVRRAIQQAHLRGLRVMLVPHLWVESGEWRALIDPVDDAGWQRWSRSYRTFLLAWADVARESGAEMLSVGVELRSWVTTSRAASMRPIIDDVRGAYPGLLTYSANWDDLEDSLIADMVDVIGVNAFYPLHWEAGASFEQLVAGGQRVEASLGRYARSIGKPIVLTEIGYTTRKDPAIKPWEWPDAMTDVVVDEKAQAEAYHAIIAPLIDAKWCAGFFVWRLYADPDDVSQEAEWGFSPRGKLAEMVLRDAFTARYAADGPWLPGEIAGRHRARTPGFFGWELSPSRDEITQAR